MKSFSVDSRPHSLDYESHYSSISAFHVKLGSLRSRWFPTLSPLYSGRTPQIPFPGFGIPLPAIGAPFHRFRVPFNGVRVPLSGFRISRSEFRLPFPGFRIPLSGFRIPFPRYGTSYSLDSGPRSLNVESNPLDSGSHSLDAEFC